MQKKIVHVIASLDVGGAEMMLYKLLSRIDRRRYDASVISLTTLGPVSKKIEALGIPTRALNMKRGLPDPRFLFGLKRRLDQEKPDLVQTWMYHADLIGGLAAKMVGDVPIVWGIRHNNLSPRINKRTTILTARLCAAASSMIPDVIICNSEASRRIHEEVGYVSTKMEVIANGFELDEYFPDETCYANVRAELSMQQEGFLVGFIGRWDSQKDHKSFVRAATMVARENPRVEFLLCGSGVSWDNRVLKTWIQETGCEQRFHLLGARGDIPRLMAALDVLVSASLGEGFSNVIGEAMACQVPCVVTDVGDSAYIVGETGLVVAPSNPQGLAGAVEQLLALPVVERKALGRRARERVGRLFDLTDVVKKYDRVYHRLLA
jgi:glycosyltransferase involved in cell wall biosynthesis